MTSGTTRMDQSQQKVDCCAWIYDMTKTTAEPVCMYFVLPIRMTWPIPWIHLFACIFMFVKSTSIEYEELEGTDKYAHIMYDGRTQKIPSEDTLFYFRRRRRTAVSMTENDGAWWVSAHTFVIDDGVTKIGNAFDRGSAGLGEITFFENLTFRQPTTDIHANYY